MESKENLIKILPRNDAHDLGGLNLTHFAMPIINTQKVVRFLVKKLKQLPDRLFPSGKMDAHMDTKSKSRTKIIS